MAAKMLPLASYARMAALLMTGRAGQPPAQVSEERQLMTGMEARVMTAAGESQMYLGPSMTGVGPKALRAERQRLLDLEAALQDARAELEGVLKVMGG